MDYPGHVVKKGASADDAAAVIAQLARRGYNLDPAPAGYDDRVVALVKLFQSQHNDVLGRPLTIDGQIGTMTWNTLFGVAAPVATVPTGLASAALGVAVSQIGVREDPPGSNRGKMVETYQKEAGVGPGNPWCMSFVFWCFEQAAGQLQKPNSFPKTGGVLDAWARVKAKSPGCIVTQKQAIADPSLVRPGLVFILDHGGGLGHTGFVQRSVGGALTTIEGNSSNDGSREGVGVFELNRRSVMNKELRGFLDFTAS